MSPFSIVLALFCTLPLTPLGAVDFPKPALIPHPAELDIPYSADNPPGPRFNEAERRQQLIDGARVRAEIQEAFKAGRDTYTVPPGDYRFDAKYQDFSGGAFAFEGLHGDPAKPFRIEGYGATLWFNLTDVPAPHHHEMIKFRNCSHLSLEGVTVDSDPRGCMDARITAFDFEGNRIQVKPVEGTRPLRSMPSRENRFIPYKANGHHIASLYQIDNGWGPGNVFYEKMEQTEDGLYWFTLRNRKLLETVRSSQWRAVYGSEGTLEVGDMVGFVYSSASAITLLNCRQITVRDSRFHAAKAGIVERDGYGDHRWINCYFMARPGTNNLLGGDGDMSSCMRGSTFDRRVVQRTTDDAFNNHGRWSHVESVAEKSMTFRKAPPQGLAPGHTAKAFEGSTDAFIATLTVERVEGRTVTFLEDVGQRFTGAGVIFREFQNEGWVIRNSIFSDCYQRIRFMCGPGIFENNLVERVGAGLVLGNGRPVEQEGGFPDDVIVRNNVFVDSGVGPALRAMRVSTKGAPVRNLQVSGNLICNSGGEALDVNWAENVSIEDNLLIRPGKGYSLGNAGQGGPQSSAGVVLRRVRGAQLSGNTVLSGEAANGFLAETDCEAIRSERNQTVTGEADRAETKVRALTREHGRGAAEIIDEVRRELGLPR